MSVRTASTVKNLILGKNTRVIYQGFTGKQATLNAVDSIEYGTKVVGGVSPGKAGKHPTIGLPVFDTVREAKKELDPHASAVFVPATLAAKAIEEAIEAEIPLIVSVAEGMPVHDCLRVQEILRTQSVSRLLGPNCPGILNPHVKCRIGLMPFKEFSPGKIAIVSRSGTLCYETVASTTRAQLGQSTVIGIGGDRTPGTTYLDALQMLAEDPTTEGIILIGEVGGLDELRALDWIKETQLDKKKPILTYFAGLCAKPDSTMGHSGAIRSGPAIDDSTARKIVVFRKAGIKVLDHIGYIGTEMRDLMRAFKAETKESSTASP